MQMCSVTCRARVAHDADLLMHADNISDRNIARLHMLVSDQIRHATEMILDYDVVSNRVAPFRYDNRAAVCDCIDRYILTAMRGVPCVIRSEMRR